MTTRVLATRGLSNVRDAFDLIRQAMAPQEFHLAASYVTEYTPLRVIANSFYLEPKDTDPNVYVEWLLGLCREQGFGLVWPQSRWSLLLQERKRFNAAGVQLLLPCPDGETLNDIQDKARANARLAGTGLSLPDTMTITTSDEFAQAAAALCNAGRRVCVKPVKSIYGLGFRLIDDSKNPFDRFLANDCFAISQAEFMRLLDLAATPPAFLAMEYLSGDERSIDCLAQQGRLVRAIVRRKPADSHWRWQVLEENREAWGIAERVVAAFQLDGLVNVQTRERIHTDGRREQCFLEVNPRMSGGLYMSCASGLNLPYWLLRLVTGTATETEIPQPAVDIKVAKIERAVCL